MVLRTVLFARGEWYCFAVIIAEQSKIISITNRPKRIKGRADLDAKSVFFAPDGVQRSRTGEKTLRKEKNIIIIKKRRRRGNPPCRHLYFNLFFFPVCAKYAVLLEERAVDGFYILHAGISGISGTAGIVIRRLCKRLQILLFHDTLKS